MSPRTIQTKFGTAMNGVQSKQWPLRLTLALVLLPFWFVLTGQAVQSLRQIGAYGKVEAMEGLIPTIPLFVVIPGLLISTLRWPNTRPVAHVCAVIGLIVFAAFAVVFATFWGG